MKHTQLVAVYLFISKFKNIITSTEDDNGWVKYSMFIIAEADMEIKYAEVHSTVILSQVDTQTFRKLGLNLTCEPKYQTKKLFHN